MCFVHTKTFILITQFVCPTIAWMSAVTINPTFPSHSGATSDLYVNSVLFQQLICPTDQKLEISIIPNISGPQVQFQSNYSNERDFVNDVAKNYFYPILVERHAVSVPVSDCC